MLILFFKQKIIQVFPIYKEDIYLLWKAFSLLSTRVRLLSMSEYYNCCLKFSNTVSATIRAVVLL